MLLRMSHMEDNFCLDMIHRTVHGTQEGNTDQNHV